MNCIYGIILVAAFVIFGWLILMLAAHADRPKCKECWSMLETQDLIEGYCSHCGADVDGLEVTS